MVAMDRKQTLALQRYICPTALLLCLKIGDASLHSPARFHVPSPPSFGAGNQRRHCEHSRTFAPPPSARTCRLTALLRFASCAAGLLRYARNDGERGAKRT